MSTLVQRLEAGRRAGRLRTTILYCAGITAALAWAIPASAASFTNSLWLGNNAASSKPLINVDRSGSILRTGPAVVVTGAAYDPVTGTLWTADQTDPTVTPYDVETLTAGTDFGSQGSHDLAFDGTDLWRAHFFDNKVHRFSTTGQLLATFDVPVGVKVMGMTWDGTKFWLTSYSTDEVYTMTSAGAFTLEFSTGNLNGDGPGGLAWDPTDGTLWVGANNGVFHYSTGGAQLGSFATDRFVDSLAFQAESTVPEPTTYALAGLALTALVRRRRRRAA